MTIRVMDWNGNEIKVGSKVIYGSPEPQEIAEYTAEVVAISDPDVVYNPQNDSDDGGYEVVVTIKFRDGDTTELSAPVVGRAGLWITGDEAEVFEEAGDLTVIT